MINLKYFLTNITEPLIRFAEERDNRVLVTRPENTKIPIQIRFLEPWFYPNSGRDEISPADRFMVYAIIFACVTLSLELILDKYASFFNSLNIVIVSIFLFEFTMRINYRRMVYFRAWGWLDITVIISDLLGIAQYYAASHGLIEWLPTEFLIVLRALRLLRLLRLVKLLFAIIRNPSYWVSKFGHLIAWTKAICLAAVWTSVALLCLVIATWIFVDQPVNVVIEDFFETLRERLGKTAGNEVQNAEVIRAIYQVFSILCGFIIVTFFTQLLVPIVHRINRERDRLTQNSKRSGHVLIAVADEHSVGVVEEAIHVFGIYQKLQIVVLAASDLEISNSIHPEVQVEVIAGNLRSRASWMIADAETAERIIILSDEAFNIESIPYLIPDLIKTLIGRGPQICVISSQDKERDTIVETANGLKIFCVPLERLIERIEESMWVASSLQAQFLVRLMHRFDRNQIQVRDHPQIAQNAPPDITEMLKSEPSIMAIEGVSINQERSGILIHMGEDPEESDESDLIRAITELLRANPHDYDSYRFVIYVRSLHLMNLNNSIKASGQSNVWVIPIELAALLAVFHELECPGFLRAWLLPIAAQSDPNLIETREIRVKSKATYRTRRNLQDEISGINPLALVIGLVDQSSVYPLRSFTSDHLDVRKVSKGDRALVLLS